MAIIIYVLFSSLLIITLSVWLAVIYRRFLATVVRLEMKIENAEKQIGLLETDFNKNNRVLARYEYECIRLGLIAKRSDDEPSSVIVRPAEGQNKEQVFYRWQAGTDDNNQETVSENPAGKT